MPFTLHTVGGLKAALAGKAAAAKASLAGTGGIKGVVAGKLAAAKTAAMGLPVYGVASGAGAAIGAARGYLKARREAKQLGIDREKDKDEWKRLRNKRMRNNAIGGAAAGLGVGLATGLLSDTTVTFDKETRQFGVSDIGYHSAGTLAGLGYTMAQSAKKKKYTQELIDKGMDPVRAKRLAEDRYGGTVGNYLKGHLGGFAAVHGVRAIGKVGSQLGKGYVKSSK